jgi:hypothetical protein
MLLGVERDVRVVRQFHAVAGGIERGRRPAHRDIFLVVVRRRLIDAFLVDWRRWRGRIGLRRRRVCIGGWRTGR